MTSPWEGPYENGSYVTDASQIRGMEGSLRHPTTNRLIPSRSFQSRKDGEGEVQSWEATIDGVKLVIFND